MEAQIRNAVALDGKSELSQNGFMPLNVTATVSESAGNEYSFSSQSMLDEMDSYMEDINARLLVSRMVSTSVIKGMVRAIEQDCAEKNSLKEGLTNLNTKLQNHDAILKCRENTISMEENVVFNHSTFKSSAISHIEYVNRLRIEVEEWIKKLKEEVGFAMRTDLSQADAKHVEVELCRNYTQTETLHRFDMLEGCINFLGMLLTKMSAYIGAIIPSEKALICEQESKKDYQIDDCTTILQSLITGLHHVHETSIHSNKTFMNDLKEKWQRKCNELAKLRCELDDLHKSFISWETGLLCPHVGHENLVERNSLKRKNQVYQKPVGKNIASHDESSPIVIEKLEEPEKPINVDSPQLMSMMKEELISYFKTEMTKMKRQHDVALQEKTEELFSLKREFLKEKGSNHLNFKKDKEFELMRKKIVGTVSKLDGIIAENEILCTILDDYEGPCSFREKIDGILLENQRLISLLAVKKKESLPDCSKVLDTSNQLPNICVGLEDVEQIEKLQWDMEALKIEMSNKDAIISSALRQLSGELRDRVEGLEMETQFDQCMYSFILRDVVRDILSRINTVMMKCYEEKNSVLENLLEKIKEFCLEVDKNKILKQQKESASSLLEMKEKLASDLEFAFMQKSEQFDSICHERDILSDQVCKQEMIIAESKKESDVLKSRLDVKFHEVNQHQAKINKLNQTLKTVSAALSDAEKQKNILQSEIVENQAELISEIEKGKEQIKQVELILSYMLELSKSLEELEPKIIDIMECNESRLKVLSCQCDGLSQQAKKLLWYKELFERRCEDLQKAETEVDLLADEVDYLISLLGKIYLALEHYSSVLQYYPGVMETLNLIRREIKG